MANNRDNHLWLQLWQNDEIDFHQKSVNLLLTQFWPKLEFNTTSRVFVPLCGKSLDMLWLAQQGYQVLGIELSSIAVSDFFLEIGLQPIKTHTKHFTLWQHGNISILCGDYFKLSKKDLGHIDTVYDRAALTALPEDLRKSYVAHLTRIISHRSKVFLLTIEDAGEGETLKQALGIGDEIKSLYTENFEINLTHVESIYEQVQTRPGAIPVRAEHKVYQLTRKHSKTTKA